MSLARAFTKRTKRSNTETSPPMPRSTTIKYPPGTINRNLISLPTELISTTNVHALTAPDIRKGMSNSSTSSLQSGNDSDFSTIDKSFLGADSSSLDSSPTTPMTPPMDHGKDFFATKPTPTEASVPAVPQRAPSHSKEAHVDLSRKRSIQRMSPPPTAIGVATTRNSTDIFASAADNTHPFGRELAQVNEVAEEFGASRALLDEEEQEMLSKGLCKFSVSDYLDEIAGLYHGGVFEDQLGHGLNPWI